jgi:hypothetical protein
MGEKQRPRLVNSILRGFEILDDRDAAELLGQLIGNYPIRFSTDQIMDAMSRLTDRERDALFARLCETYQLPEASWNDDAGRPWGDVRNGFSPREEELLRLLDGWGIVHERKVIRGMYGLQAAGRAYDRLRDRLRQVQKRVNDRLLRLQVNWTVRRPSPNHLHLTTFV